jgi:hypothetical protein
MNSSPESVSPPDPVPDLSQKNQQVYLPPIYSPQKSVYKIPVKGLQVNISSSTIDFNDFAYNGVLGQGRIQVPAAISFGIPFVLTDPDQPVGDEFTPPAGNDQIANSKRFGPGLLNNYFVSGLKKRAHAPADHLQPEIGGGRRGI